MARGTSSTHVSRLDTFQIIAFARGAVWTRIVLCGYVMSRLQVTSPAQFVLWAGHCCLSIQRLPPGARLIEDHMLHPATRDDSPR